MYYSFNKRLIKILCLDVMVKTIVEMVQTSSAAYLLRAVRRDSSPATTTSVLTTTVYAIRLE